MFSQEWPQVRDYINRIRRAFPHAKIIVGGEHPTAMSEYTLRDCPARGVMPPFVKRRRTACYGNDRIPAHTGWTFIAQSRMSILSAVVVDPGVKGSDEFEGAAPFCEPVILFFPRTTTIETHPKSSTTGLPWRPSSTTLALASASQCTSFHG
jgi:hypothetical protein